jgi:riboflavin transporter FmnP
VQPAPTVWNPSPGLRPFLLVMLILTDLVTGFFALFGLLALADYLGLIGSDNTPGEPAAFVLIGVFVLLFTLTVAATVGVIRRSAWARVVTLVAGAAVSLTCLGLVLGIPILIAASRAPIKRRAQTPA